MKQHAVELKQAQSALRRWLHATGAPEAFAILADLVPGAAVMAVDRDRNIVLWSDEAERLLGYRRDEVLGRHCLTGIRCVKCMIGCGIAEQGAVHGVPVTLHRADGEPVTLLKHAQAFFDPSGAFAGGIEVLVPAATVEEPVEAPLPAGAREFHGLVSRDPVMHRAFDTIRNVAETEATVLIRGESGTGKELVARALHRESHRNAGPFVAVNCAALTPSLLESELFGHVRGAFTGAVSDRAGIFEQANGGTLFLDEVAELPVELQAKLLRVLQERAYVPVGGQTARSVDVRLVAATHQSLRDAVREGRFREDLMYRLRVVPLFLPPLRERRTDIELLIRHFVDVHNERGPRRVRTIAPDAMRALLDHDWPGNVRELRNVIEYAFAVGRGPELRIDELPPEFREERSPRALHREPSGAPPVDEAESIRRALDQARGHVGDAAALLGMSRPTFWRKRRKYGI